MKKFLLFIILFFSTFVFAGSSPIEYKDVAVGKYHTLAVKNDGTLWAWGENKYGQLGISSTVDKLTAVQVGTLTNWLSVSAGRRHSLAIKDDGTLWAWGYNNYGQVGDGSNADINAPAQIGADTNWAILSAGRYHSVAIKKDGTLWTWGRNNNGQLGNGSTTNVNVPAQIGTDINWLSISAGKYYNMAIKTDATLWTWGENTYGQLGNSTNTNSTIPIQIGSSTNWLSISAGRHHSSAIKTDGTLWTWGLNNRGQLGNGSITDTNTPAQLGSSTDWKQVSGGKYHTIALKTTGTLWAWGDNYYGQLGIGNTVDSLVPIQVGLATNWVDIGAGRHHNIAMQDTGNLFVWGYNNRGQFGNGTISNSSVTLQVGSAVNWVKMSAGYNHTTAVKSDGTLWSWGLNEYGQLGDGTLTNKNLTTQVDVGTTWLDVSAGKHHTIATKTDGTLWSWGENENGQLGDGTLVDKSSPVQVGTDTNWSKISAGEHYNLSIQTDGTLWSWGANTYGQLGDGANLDINIASKIGVDTNWSKVSAGRGHSLAIKSDGTLWSWGYNSNGQLGDGTTSNTNTPSQVGVDTNWSEISAGRDFSLAIKTDGTLWAWGKNYFGQLGDGTTVDKTTPVQIGVDTTWISISGGAYHSLGLKSDGSLLAWGLNDDGQLSDNTFIDKTSPTLIGTSWNIIGAGEGHSVAIDSVGTLWSWGDNGAGQLGYGTFFHSPSQSFDSLGTILSSITDSDDTEQVINIGFTFEFFGLNYTQLTVSSNGYLKPGNELASGYGHLWDWDYDVDGVAIIAPFWTDLDPSIGGDIYYKLEGASPNQVLTISYIDVLHYNQISNKSTFYVRLYETSNQIQYHYGEIQFNEDIDDFGIQDSSLVGLYNGSNILYSLGESRNYNEGNLDNSSIKLDYTSSTYVLNVDSPSFTQSLCETLGIWDGANSICNIVSHPYGKQDIVFNLSNLVLANNNIVNIEILGVDKNNEITNIDTQYISDGNSTYSKVVYAPDNNYSIRIDTNDSGSFKSWWYNFSDSKLYEVNDLSSSFKTLISSSAFTFNFDVSSSNFTSNIAPIITAIYDRYRLANFAAFAVDFNVSDANSDTLSVSMTPSSTSVISANLSTTTVNGSATITISVSSILDKIGSTDLTLIVSDSASSTVKTFRVEVGTAYDIIRTKEANSITGISYTGNLYLLSSHLDQNNSQEVEIDKLNVVNSVHTNVYELHDINSTVTLLQKTQNLPSTFKYESSTIDNTTLSSLYTSNGMSFTFNDANSSGQKIYITYPDGWLESYTEAYGLNGTYTSLDTFLADQVEGKTTNGILRNRAKDRVLVLDVSELGGTSGSLIEYTEDANATGNNGVWNRFTFNGVDLIELDTSALSGYDTDIALMVDTDGLVKYAQHIFPNDVYSYILLNQNAKNEIYKSLSPNPKIEFSLAANTYTYISLTHTKSLCDSYFQSAQTTLCDQNNTIESILGSNSDIDMVLKYQDSWLYWDSNTTLNLSYTMNKLSIISPLDGLLIKALNATKVLLPYDDDASSVNNYASFLSQKWYLLSNNKDQTIAQIIASIPTGKTIEYILTYRDNAWHIYAPLNDSSIDASLTRLTEIKRSESFWIILK